MKTLGKYFCIESKLYFLPEENLGALKAFFPDETDSSKHEEKLVWIIKHSKFIDICQMYNF